jgi:ribosomal protein S18 acetylase RimI-like enzyme
MHRTADLHAQLAVRLAAHLATHLAGSSGLRCRPANSNDEAFLRSLFASVKGQALQASGLAPQALENLLHMQFEAQRRHYQAHYPGGMPWVLERQGAPAGQPPQLTQPLGQMWLQLDDQSLRLMDLAILPAHCRQGLASICLRALTQFADAHGLAMHLHVSTDDPVRHWYARLGFVTTHTQGLHQAMTRSAVDQESFHEQA